MRGQRRSLEVSMKVGRAARACSFVFLLLGASSAAFADPADPSGNAANAATANAVGATTANSAGSAAPSATTATTAAITATATTAVADMSDADLEAKVAPLAAADEASRTAAATAMGLLGPDAEAAVLRKLATLRKGDDSAIYDVVRAARSGHSPDDDLATTMATYGHVERPAAVRASQIASLIAACAHMATLPALREMTAWTAPASGVFRLDITRRVKLLGDRAVPALIEARKDTSSDVRHWAFAQLEALGKRVPGDAVQTKDNALLADTLHAFGVTHDMDALAVVLSFVNSDRVQVRDSARQALAAYGQDAIWKLREAYTNLLGKPAPDDWNADRVSKELFAAYDRYRLEDVYALFDQGLAAQTAGKNEDAVTAFDKVLARQPMLDRRSEMVPAYAALGLAAEETDRPKARALLRKAERLDPTGPRANQLEAELTTLEGLDLLSKGIADEDVFRTALKLDPANVQARKELDRLESDGEAREEKTHRWAAGGAILLLAIAGILLFGGRRRATA